MRAWMLHHKLTIAGFIIGAVSGYLYYYWIGCASGSCPITSQPINSSLYGAMMGALAFSSFKKEKQKNERH